MEEKKTMQNGYTTGACAAAGAKAALLYREGEYVDMVEILALDGTVLHIPIASVREDGDGWTAEVVKFSGDDPDITNGASIFTQIRFLEKGAGLVFRAGVGVGTVTKPGLSVAVGEPSINPGPKKLIANVIEEIMGQGADVEVTISIPAGVELAKKTLNPVLGVEGGISVIGTTGVLRPMSEEGFKNSLLPQIDVAKALGHDTVVFVPGKIGETLAIKYHLPKEILVQTSNFIGFLLEGAAEREIKNILLMGHIGKLAKIAAGVFHTHNRVGDARLETMAAYAAAEGLNREGVCRILSANTTEDALEVIDAAGLSIAYHRIAERASVRAERYLFGKLRVGSVLVTLQGRILGLDRAAWEIGKAYQWTLPGREEDYFVEA